MINNSIEVKSTVFFIKMDSMMLFEGLHSSILEIE